MFYLGVQVFIAGYFSQIYFKGTGKAKLHQKKRKENIELCHDWFTAV